MAAHDGAKTLTPPHPWHHRTYLDVPSIRDGSKFMDLPVCDPTRSGAVTFMSATTQHVDRLDVAHWRTWLTTPVDFKGALERLSVVATVGVTASAHATADNVTLIFDVAFHEAGELPAVPAPFNLGPMPPIRIDGSAAYGFVSASTETLRRGRAPVNMTFPEQRLVLNG